MIELLRNFLTMLRASWEADRARSIGALVTTALVPVTRPLRAIGLAVIADGIVAGDLNRAVTGGLIVAGLTAANRLFDWASLTIRMRLREHTILLLDERVIELAAGAPGLEHHERPEHQDQMELLRTDRDYLVNPFMPIAWTVAAVIQIAATVLVLAGLHPILALLPVAGLPSLALTAQVERRQDLLRREQAEEARLRLHLFELATLPAAAKEVRVFDLSSEIGQRYLDSVHRIEGRQLRHNVRAGAMLAAGWSVFAGAYMAAVAFVAARALDGDLLVGSVVLVLSLGAQLNTQLSELVQNTTWFTRTANAVGRYRWLLDYVQQANEAVQPADPVSVPDSFVSGIKFDNVTFAYPGTDTPVLTDLNLQLPAGSTVAIVGENGAGKTTLMKLLLRFYEPTEGSILVDGIELDRFDLDEWRARASAGFQDFARFQLLARHAVGVGRLPELDDEAAVRGALSRASAGDLPDGLPHGLSTYLGREFEEGMDLSMGQWQKIAVARAMMRQGPLLLVLDEPTASLDATTEHELFERFTGAAREAAQEVGAITLLVSHRFSTVRMADLIVVIADGRVAEVGSHAELTALGGLYAELYELQASSYR